MSELAAKAEELKYAVVEKETETEFSAENVADKHHLAIFGVEFNSKVHAFL